MGTGPVNRYLDNDSYRTMIFLKAQSGIFSRDFWSRKSRSVFDVQLITPPISNNLKLSPDEQFYKKPVPGSY